MIYADGREVMAVILCDTDVASWNHYLVCALVLAVFCFPLGSPNGSRGNVCISFIDLDHLLVSYSETFIINGVIYGKMN